MKSILLCVSFLLTGYLVNGQEAINQVELSKVSRGYEEHIRITPDSLYVFIENKMGQKPATNFSRKVTKKEWTNLVAKGIGKGKVTKFKDLPSPTMKRAYDGAMHSTITVTTGGESVSHGYDDENPHAALLPLLKQIRALSGVKGKP